MLRTLTLLLVLALTTLGQTTPPPTLTRTVLHDGLVRTFRVHVPAGYQPGVPVPLVFGFHGGGGNAATFENFRFDLTADQHGFLLVLPEGTGPRPNSFVLQTWNAGACCGGAATNNVDDVGFVDAMIDAIDQEWPLDHRRIYATGFSNGGMMSYRLGVELAHRIAAIAPVGASLMAPTTPTRPVPIIAIHGALDTNVPWQGGPGTGVAGVNFTSQQFSLEAFRLANQAALFPTQPDQILGQALLYTAAAPTTGATMHYWWLLDGGHTWPGNRAIVNPSEPRNLDLDANEAIWAFFAAHPKAASTTELSPGCRPTLAAPTLTTSLPVLGTDLAITIRNAPPLVPGFLFVAPPAQVPPTPIGACSTPLDVANALLFATLPASTTHDLLLPVPTDPALHRLAIDAQALWLTPTGPILSNAQSLRFGW